MTDFILVIIGVILYKGFELVIERLDKIQTLLYKVIENGS